MEKWSDGACRAAENRHCMEKWSDGALGEYGCGGPGGVGGVRWSELELAGVLGFLSLKMRSTGAWTPKEFSDFHCNLGYAGWAVQQSRRCNLGSGI